MRSLDNGAHRQWALASTCTDFTFTPAGKYCSHNPYAAQAAAASLLAGAAWLEAVQKLQTLNSMMDPVGVKARNSS